MNKPVWKLKESVDHSLAGLGPLPHLIGKILINRGVSESELNNFIYPKLSDLKDPFLMKGMSEAVDRIIQAKSENQTVCVYADFDLDGTSGLALLKTGLEGLGFKQIIPYQPKRLSQGYGFHKEAIDELKQKNVSLIITVDVGITAFEACEYAAHQGIDVIITDHHLPQEKLPLALQVVNPNRMDDESGLGYLCGAGVAFYLLRALRSRLQSNYDLKSVLDFFTIATLTDMVPLVGDNRVLVKHGLNKLSNTDKPGLKALLEELKLTNRELTSQDVAIRFAPKLNALSRMETDILPIDIMLEKDAKTANEMIAKVIDNNSKRILLQNNAEVEALELLRGWDVADFIYVSSEKFHRGVVGLIATKLSQQFNRPCFVGSKSAEGTVVGSARIPKDSEICLVEALKSSEDILTRFGGHSAAAGFELYATVESDLIGKLSQHFKQQKLNPKPVEYHYDVATQLSEINTQLMKWYDFIGPFGAGFDYPLIQFKQLEIINKKTLSGGHLRLRLADSTNDKQIDGLIFSPLSRHLEILEKAKTLDVLGELQWNYFSGQKNIQILIRDMREAN